MKPLCTKIGLRMEPVRFSAVNRERDFRLMFHIIGVLSQRQIRDYAFLVQVVSPSRDS